MQQPFKICIRCSDGRESEPVRLEFATKGDFLEWIKHIRINISECQYLTNDDLDHFEKKARNHFS